MNPQDPLRPNPSNGTLPSVDPSLYTQAPPQPAPQPTPQPVPTPTTPTPLPAYQDPKTAGEYTVDYLNSIAPNQQKAVNKFAVFALIGGVIIAAVFVLILIAMPKGSSSANDLIPPLSLRIETLQTVTKAQQAHLNENQVSQANATLNSALDSMDTDIQAIIKDRKLTKSLPSGKKTAEKTYATDLSKTLDDAYQRGTLDRVYASQMTYELTILDSKLTSLKKSTTNKTIDAFCDDAIKNVELILGSLETFDASKQ